MIRFPHARTALDGLDGRCEMGESDAENELDFITFTA
jgi:hypothetical protein